MIYYPDLYGNTNELSILALPYLFGGSVDVVMSSLRVQDPGINNFILNLPMLKVQTNVEVNNVISRKVSRSSTDTSITLNTTKKFNVGDICIIQFNQEDIYDVATPSSVEPFESQGLAKVNAEMSRICDNFQSFNSSYFNGGQIQPSLVSVAIGRIKRSQDLNYNPATRLNSLGFVYINVSI